MRFLEPARVIQYGVSARMSAKISETLAPNDVVSASGFRYLVKRFLPSGHFMVPPSCRREWRYRSPSDPRKEAASLQGSRASYELRTACLSERVGQAIRGYPSPDEKHRFFLVNSWWSPHSLAHPPYHAPQPQAMAVHESASGEYGRNPARWQLSPTRLSRIDGPFRSIRQALWIGRSKTGPAGVGSPTSPRHSSAGADW